MIIDEDRLILKELLGTRWTTDVSNLLQQKGIKAISGKPYSTSQISNVYSGRRSNAQIEEAIWTLAEQRKEAIVVLEKRKSLLKQKNPVSGHSTGVTH